jgi:cytochrome P450
MMQRLETEKAIQKQGTDAKNIRQDMIHYLINAKDQVTGRPALSQNDLLAEANLLVVAGSDTTSVAICGFWFYITRNPSAYARLTKEIRSTFESADEIQGGAKLNSCEYLRACIDETLRMCPPGGAELDRVVMRGGQEIEGQVLPEGVHVGCTAWGITRNEEYFRDPNVYRPERWIVDEAAGVTADDVARAQSCFFPFSLGPYNCVGKNLAILEMMVTIARTLYRMDARRLPGDKLGEGSPELCWGRRERHVFQMRDAWIFVRNGPMVQFKKRELKTL